MVRHVAADTQNLDIRQLQRFAAAIQRDAMMRFEAARFAAVLAAPTGGPKRPTLHCRERAPVRLNRAPRH